MKTRLALAKAHATALFASILQVLVDNGCIQVKEVGILAQVSKEVYMVTLDDDIWASLCQREYPGTNSLKSRFVKSKGYRGLYRRWSAPVDKRQRVLPSLPPPSCTEEQIQFAFHVKYKGVIINSQHRHSMRRIFRRGYAKIRLDKPLVLGKAEWDVSEREMATYDMASKRALPVRCQEELDVCNFEMKIHVLRDCDLAMCCVFDSSEGCRILNHRFRRVRPLVQDGERFTSQTKFDLSKHQKRCMISFASTLSKGLPLKRSFAALDIMNRLASTIQFEVELMCRILKSGDFAITHIMTRAVKSERVFGFSSIYNSEEEADKHGVTLLHILSELDEA